MKEFITVTEAANALGVSRQTVNKWIRAGKIPVYKGRRLKHRATLFVVLSEIQKIVEIAPTKLS